MGQEAIDLASLQYDYAVINAEIDLALLEGNSHLRNFSGGLFRLSYEADVTHTNIDERDYFTSTAALVYRYAERGRFNAAFDLAELLMIDPSELFEKYVDVCQLMRNADVVP